MRLEASPKLLDFAGSAASGASPTPKRGRIAISWTQWGATIGPLPCR
jgi:hypothetical protein